MNKKRYINPQTEIIVFVSSESVMGYGVGEGSTNEQLSKGTNNIDMDDDEQNMNVSVWDE